MKVVLLGTGAADGVPQPFCRCPGCTAARRTGLRRGPTSALVDGRLLIDAPPGIGGAAAAAGVDLVDVDTIAITHAHPDHWDPSLLLYRSWQTDRPLRLIGPAQVLAAVRAWLAPDAAVELVEAIPGRAIDVNEDGMRLTVLPSTHGGREVDAGADTGEAVDQIAAEAVLFDVRDPSGALLYGCDTGLPDARLLTAVTDARYDLALLDFTFGVAGPTTSGHLDHHTFPQALAELRSVGALTDATDVVAVHLSHHQPAPDELAAALHGWGARAVPDGTVLTAGVGAVDAAHAAEADAGSLTLITGGVRSGKSRFAESQARSSGCDITYLATGRVPDNDDEDDEDWRRRVDQHRARRPAHWRTVETVDLVAALLYQTGQQRSGGHGQRPGVIIDCLGSWVAQVLDQAAGWDDADLATKGGSGGGRRAGRGARRTA